ncbi:MAG: hypothetical protein GX146_10270 [Myxococcales bacterium]|nr:hypothetical protein [Myxococcales bacterium]
MAIWLCSAAAWAWSEERPPLRREGLVMGLDPGLVLRHVDDEWKLFARLNLRFAGCIGPRVQMGVDWRMEIFTAGQGSNVPNRHEIGPVLTVFAHKGWFFRFYSHVGALHPFRVTVGAGTGYEWSLGRFTGMGVAVGGDVDILFTGAPPPAQAVFVVWHLSAYDLKTRRGRED